MLEQPFVQFLSSFQGPANHFDLPKEFEQATLDEMLQVVPEGPNAGTSGLWWTARCIKSLWRLWKQYNQPETSSIFSLSYWFGGKQGPTPQRRHAFKQALLSRAPQHHNASALFWFMRVYKELAKEIFESFADEITLDDLLVGADLSNSVLKQILRDHHDLAIKTLMRILHTHKRENRFPDSFGILFNHLKHDQKLVNVQHLFELAETAYDLGYRNAYYDLGTTLRSIGALEQAYDVFAQVPQKSQHYPELTKELAEHYFAQFIDKKEPAFLNIALEYALKVSDEITQKELIKKIGVYLLSDEPKQVGKCAEISDHTLDLLHEETRLQGCLKMFEEMRKATQSPQNSGLARLRNF